MDRQDRNCFVAGVALGVAGTLAAQYVIEQHLTPEQITLPPRGEAPAQPREPAAREPQHPAAAAPAEKAPALAGPADAPAAVYVPAPEKPVWQPWAPAAPAQPMPFAPAAGAEKPEPAPDPAPAAEEAESAGEPERPVQAGAEPPAPQTEQEPETPPQPAPAAREPECAQAPEPTAPQTPAEPEPPARPAPSPAPASPAAPREKSVEALRDILCAIAQKYAHIYFRKELDPALFELSLVRKNERDQFVPVTDPAAARELYLFGADEAGRGEVLEFIMCYDTALRAMTCFGLRTAADKAMVYADLLR